MKDENRDVLVGVGVNSGIVKLSFWILSLFSQIQDWVGDALTEVDFRLV